jgi:hypothetical protein
MGFAALNPSYKLLTESVFMASKYCGNRGKVMGFVELVIGPATSGRTRWLSPSSKLR